MITAVFTIVLVMLAAISKAVMDTLQFHFSRSVFKEWNEFYFHPAFSWANKYKDVVTLKPKFWGSTTIFSFITDGWHLFQAFYLLFIFTAIVIHQPFFVTINSSFLSMLLDFSILMVIFGLTFELFYAKIFIKK